MGKEEWSGHEMKIKNEYQLFLSIIALSCIM